MEVTNGLSTYSVLRTWLCLSQLRTDTHTSSKKRPSKAKAANPRFSGGLRLPRTLPPRRDTVSCNPAELAWKHSNSRFGTSSTWRGLYQKKSQMLVYGQSEETRRKSQDVGNIVFQKCSFKSLTTDPKRASPPQS